MYDLQACRACLNQNCKLELINDRTSRIYCTVTGLDFTPGDRYPSYLCTECSTQIKKILAFRRRCRRAFFALEEIVAVKKLVTLTDLSTIERKKRNLASDVDYWMNNNIGFYSVNKDEEIDIKPSDIEEFVKEFESKNHGDIKPDIDVYTTRYDPDVINHTYIAVDIKPDNCEDVKDEVCQKVEYPSDDLIDVNNDMEGYYEAADDNVADDIVADIDLEDVFKGLPEEISDEDSDYGLSEMPMSELEENQNSHKNENERHCGLQEKTALKFSRILEDFDIQLLSFEEQVATFQARKEMEPYKSAKLKCTICLMVYLDISDLLKHVQEHNKKQEQLTQKQRKNFQCAICKNSFSCRAELTAHSACYHWYKYTCTKCHAKIYTLLDTSKCHYRPPIQESTYYSMEELFKMSDMRAQVDVAPMPNNCRRCGWPINSKPSMVKHEKSHVETPEAPLHCGRYQCDMCGLWCRAKAHLERHIQMHYRTFTCQQCPKVFEGWEAAQDHLKQHKMLRCSHCDKLFQSDQERSEHEEAKHRSDFALDCDLCEFSANSFALMYYHQLTYHGYISINRTSAGDPKHLCGMCGVQFDDEAALKAHKVEQGHVKADTLGGKCESCKKVFYTVGELIAHRRAYTGCRIFPVKCAYCDQILEHSDMSKQHYEEEHPSQPSEHQKPTAYTICEVCGKSITRVNFKKHRELHSQGKLLLTCSLCHHKSLSSSAFANHMLFKHTPRPYMCAQCPYRTKNRSHCRDHILRVHEPVLPYDCQKCPEKFSHPEYLAKHSMKAHGVSDERKFAQVLTGGCYVFPHMKLDGSFIPVAILEKADLYLYDFLCKSRKLVDWKDYYVFNTGVHTLNPLHKEPQRKKRGRKPKKPVDERIKSTESQSCNVEVKSEVNEDRRKKSTCESDVAHDKVKRAKLDETSSYYDENTDIDNGQHEKMVQENDSPDLQADISGEPSEASPYGLRKRPQRKPCKKRAYRKKSSKAEAINKGNESQHEEMVEEINVVSEKPSESEPYVRRKRPQKKPYKKSKSSKPVYKVTVKANESQSVNNINVKSLDKVSYVDNVEHDKMVEGKDTPELQEAILGDASEDETVLKQLDQEETVAKVNEDLDMTQLLNENYQVIEQNGEKYVIAKGNLYKLLFE